LFPADNHALTGWNMFVEQIGCTQFQE
jgi:hypothetical protein